MHTVPQLWSAASGACRRRRRTHRLQCQAHHYSQRHGHGHHTGKDSKAHRHGKQPQQQEGSSMALLGGAVHVVEEAVEHGAEWTRSRASALLESVEASLPPLPPSREELLEHGPAYAALAAAASLLALLFWRCTAALWRLLFGRRRQRPAAQAASTQQRVAAEESVAAAAAAAAEPVVIPDADSTAALQRVTISGTSLNYASTLWIITSLLVLFSSDLLNTVSSLRP